MARLGACVVATFALLFVAAMGLFAWGFLTSKSPVGIALGVGVALLTPVVLWTIVRELAFGRAAARLGRIEAENDALAGVDIADFPAAKAHVEANEDSWLAWYRLAFSYEANGDRRRARRAMRQAIACESRERKNGGVPLN